MQALLWVRPAHPHSPTVVAGGRVVSPAAEGAPPGGGPRQSGDEQVEGEEESEQESKTFTTAHGKRPTAKAGLRPIVKQTAADKEAARAAREQRNRGREKAAQQAKEAADMKDAQ